MMPVVVQGSASPALSRRLSKELGWRLVRPEVRRFPDGEIYIRITSPMEEAVVVQSLSPPQNEHLVELLLLLDLCRDLGAKRLTAVVPYLAYARQDKRFKEGEALSIKTVARLLELADKVLVVEAHSKEALSYFKRIEEVKVFRVLGSYLANLSLKNPLFLSPDEGSLERVKEAAQVAGAEFDFLKKERLSGTRVKTEWKKIDAEGRDVVILDDIISTGSTMVEAARLVGGGRRVLACCVHGLFSNGALRKMARAGIKEILSTDTVESDQSRISVASPLAKHLL
jgi:ribose-phosphate pyrophosphokinase